MYLSLTLSVSQSLFLSLSLSLSVSLSLSLSHRQTRLAKLNHVTQLGCPAQSRDAFLPFPLFLGPSLPIKIHFDPLHHFGSSKQPIRTRHLGHMTGYQPIRDQHFHFDLFWCNSSNSSLSLSLSPYRSIQYSPYLTVSINKGFELNKFNS
eukprot:sb/3473584/